MKVVDAATHFIIGHSLFDIRHSAGQLPEAAGVGAALSIKRRRTSVSIRGSHQLRLPRFPDGDCAA